MGKLVPELAGAACRTYLTPDHWLSNRATEGQAAMRVCLPACPCLQACRSWALDQPLTSGVIGGLSSTERGGQLAASSISPVSSSASPARNTG